MVGTSPSSGNCEKHVDCGLSLRGQQQWLSAFAIRRLKISKHIPRQSISAADDLDDTQCAWRFRYVAGKEQIKINLYVF